MSVATEPQSSSHSLVQSSSSPLAASGSNCSLKKRTADSPTSSVSSNKRPRVVSPTTSLEQTNTVIKISATQPCSAQPVSAALAQPDHRPAATNSNNMVMEVETNGVAANGAGSDGEGGGAQYDENLYSRQIYTLGEQAMTRLRRARVLVCGMNGLGVEIAKNLILAGARHVHVQDTKKATWNDLSAQFYLSERDIGRNRVEASLPLLEELNDTVDVHKILTPITKELVNKYHVVALCDSTAKEQDEVGAWCRQTGVKLLLAETRGLFGYVFCDFGDAHMVDDPNGEKPREVLIEHIDGVTGEVTTLEDAYHGFEDGDYVSFCEVQGMVELNEVPDVKIETTGPTKFKILTSTCAGFESFSRFTEGGRVKQVKKSKQQSFMPLAESLQSPEFLITNFEFFDRPIQLLIGWRALYQFMEQNGRTPKAHDETDAATVLQLAEALRAQRYADSCEQLDANLLKELCYQANGNLCPVNGFIGGFAAQEVMKAVTNIFTPLSQWMFFDALECLPPADCKFVRTAETCAPTNSRYDGQVAVFGAPLQQALGAQSWFMVGSGAIGCELLKNLSMMGVSSAGGKLTVTDMDNIEISNLNRQFLFRRHNVGQNKAQCATEAVRAFNPQLKVEALQQRVGGPTEDVFNDAFFEKLNGVLNALDNVEARQYMDRRCTYYQLPLLESGTQGPKGNTQVVFPHLTETYSETADPPDKSIPICTVKNFPHAIEHCIQYARELFEGLFTEPADVANQYVDNPRAFQEQTQTQNPGQQFERLESVRKSLIADRPSSSEDTVRWGRLLFQEQFYNQIAQLLHNFPPDQVTNGARFWSGAKKCPHPLEFDVDNEEHVDFVWSAAALRAEMYGLPVVDDKEVVAKLAAAVDVPAFVPRTGVKIAVTDAEHQSQSDSLELDEEVVQKIWLELAKWSKNHPKLRVNPVFFEKDDDSNRHMDFMTCCSNLRAENYVIEKSTKSNTKQIAGRIIPAIATTTAAIAAFVCIEFYKVVLYRCLAVRPSIDSFNNSFLNLALPFYAAASPGRAAVKKFDYTDATGAMQTYEFTNWDRIDVDGSEVRTLQELFDHIKTRFNLNVTMLSQGVSMIYSFFMNPAKSKQRLEMTIPAIVEDIAKAPIPSHVRALVLEPMCEQPAPNDDVDIETPYIRYILPRSEMEH